MTNIKTVGIFNQIKIYFPHKSFISIYPLPPPDQHLIKSLMVTPNVIYCMITVSYGRAVASVLKYDSSRANPHFRAVRANFQILCVLLHFLVEFIPLLEPSVENKKFTMNLRLLEPAIRQYINRDVLIYNLKNDVYFKPLHVVCLDFPVVEFETLRCS